MTRDQTSTVLAIFAAAWPWATVGKDTTRLWWEALKDEPLAMAREAALELARTDDRPPSMARFRETRRSLIDPHAPSLLAIAERCDTPEPDTAELREWVADMKATLVGAVERVAKSKQLPEDLVAEAKAEARHRDGMVIPEPCRCLKTGEPCEGIVDRAVKAARSGGTK